MLEGKELAADDFYMSPEGYKVFTEQYHLKRGYCCEADANIVLMILKIKSNRGMIIANYK